MQITVLGLADVGLTFFTEAYMVLCFSLVTQTVLVTQQSFEHGSTMLVQHQVFIFFPAFSLVVCRLGVRKLGGRVLGHLT